MQRHEHNNRHKTPPSRGVSRGGCVGVPRRSRHERRYTPADQRTFTPARCGGASHSRRNARTLARRGARLAAVGWRGQQRVRELASAMWVSRGLRALRFRVPACSALKQRLVRRAAWRPPPRSSSWRTWPQCCSSTTSCRSHGSRAPPAARLCPRRAAAHLPLSSELMTAVRRRKRRSTPWKHWCMRCAQSL